ncbi:alpha/beta fold hydrolase [Roseovarius sp.]|uniref:alpha/beta fold hydrolase n=1 Tax=Roseovarius sp. TaxID=1486281 RepID=UPI003B5A2CDF
MPVGDYDADLASVFSILPRDKAREARDYVAKRLKVAEAAIEDDLAWADFDRSGKLLRGGLSSITDHSTRILPAETDNPQIAAILGNVARHGLSAGHISWDPGVQMLFWYVPITPSNRDNFGKRRLRGFAVTQLLFSEFLDIFNEDSGLTQAEIRTVFQVIGGASLRAAADLDALSYETKRAHLKNACSKLMCSGQRELITKLLGQMVHFISISEGEASHAGFIEPFFARYLSRNARLLSRRLSDGRLVNIVEFGPPGGRPVLLSHGVLFALLMRDAGPHLERLGLRVITPIREGYLEIRPTSSLFDQDDLLRQWVDDAHGLIREYIGHPCVVVGNSTGARAAVRLALEAPKEVASLVLVSPTLMQTESLRTGKIGGFFDALRGLVSNSRLFKAVTWRFKKYYLSEKTCRVALMQLFGDNAADREVLERPFSSDASSYAMFSDIYSSSLRGVAADFSFDFDSVHREMLALKMPFSILHGRDDPMLRAAEMIAQLPEPLGRTVNTLDGGHFLGVTAADAVWDHVAAQNG